MRASTATPLPERALPFLIRYVSLRPWHFGAMFLLIVGAASCAVAVQYGMKMLVDVMTLGDRRRDRKSTRLNSSHGY